MMHLLDFAVKSNKVAKDTWTVGYSWSVCSHLVPHSDVENLKTLTKDGGQVTCPDCIMRMLSDV